MNRHSRLQLLASTLALALSSAPTVRAQTTGGDVMPATGRDFEAQKVQKFGAMNADVLCERLFDSADTTSMATELLSIVGPSIVLGKVPALAAQSKVDQKKQFDSLRTLARQKVWLPVAAERKVGEWLDRKYRKDSLVIEAATLPRNQRTRFEMTQEVLDGIVLTLPADNPYTFSLNVAEANESNASISPGGFVYVTTGMLQDKTLDRDDIALRLSHEVSHLTRRHALKELQIKLVDALEIAKDTKPLLDFAQQPARAMETLLGTMKSTELMFQRFDQVQELEADACGAYLLVRQKDVNAEASIARFATARAGTATGKGKGWDSSHPAPEERERVMKAQLDPDRRVRATQPRTEGAQSGVAAGGGKASRSEARARRDDSSLASLPADAATAQPQATPKALGALLDKVKKSLPATGATLAPVAPPRDSQ
jgi:Peptidase family M48